MVFQFLGQTFSQFLKNNKFYRKNERTQISFLMKNFEMSIICPLVGLNIGKFLWQLLNEYSPDLLN